MQMFLATVRSVRSARVVPHSAAHGQVLKVGAVALTLNDEHVAAADALQWIGQAEAVVPCRFGDGVGEDGLVAVFTDDRCARCLQIGARIAVFLAVTTCRRAFGGYGVVALHDEDAVASGSVFAAVGGFERLAECAVARHNVVVEPLEV